jgi:two-component system, chemotaxis family, protein-glutamate methylesterase/glutaminase
MWRGRAARCSDERAARVSYEIVALGMSWGGLHALRAIVSRLPETFPLPVIVVQHRHKDSDNLLRDLVQDCAKIPVTDIEDKQPIGGANIYIAPPDYHTLIEGGHFSLSTEAPVKFSRPSIDVTFMSVADGYGAGSVGVVLTGANDDGAAGLRRIVGRGGYAIIQDPATAESATMPRAALKAVPEAHVLALPDIGPHLTQLVGVAEPARAAKARRR